MKKLILALLVICLLASCTDFNSEDLESQGTASIRFGRIVAKSASVSGSVADSSDLYWTYKATKADTGINAGNTGGEFVAVSTEKGLSTTISGFAPGQWTFEIRGYVSNDYQSANLIYSSDPTTATLTRNTITNVAFTVGVTDGSKGKIETQKPATVKIGDVMSSEYTVTCTGEYQGTDGTYSIPATENTTIVDVKQGIWKLTYNFKDKAETPNDLGSCSVTALVMNGATTKITLTYDDSTASKFQAEAKMPTIINDRGSIKTNLTGTTLEESTVTVKGTSTTGATCEFTVGSEAEGNIKQGIWTLNYSFARKSDGTADSGAGYTVSNVIVFNGETTTVTVDYEPQYLIKAPANTAVGDTITFGIYPSTAPANTTNAVNANYTGKGVTWKVLAVDSTNKRALVISEKILFNMKPYTAATSSNYSSYTYAWSKCDINTYLNGSFLTDYGLSDVDIASVSHTTEAGTTSQPAETTSEKVFLLSAAEANSYFAAQADKVAQDLSGTAANYWLRSPSSNYSYDVANVNDCGSVITYGLVFYSFGVRPAFWVNL